MKLIIEDAFYEILEIHDTETVLEMADFDVGLRQMLEASEATTTIATGTITLIDTSNVIQFIDPGGADRDVILPAESADNHGHLIVNTADADETITVKDDAGGVIGYVGRTGIGWFVSNGSIWKAAYAGSITANPVCEGRLTLEGGVSVSTSDQIDKSIVYFALHNGNRVSLYNGSAWVEHVFTEKEVTISGWTASKNYDMFINDDGGTLALTGVVWTNDTTRVALTKVNGILVKTSDNSYRYLGSIRIDAGQKCQDTLLKRYCWNYYNRVAKHGKVTESAASWTYGSAAWRYINADSTNKVEIVIGVIEDPIMIRHQGSMLNAAGDKGINGIGVNASNSNSADAKGYGFEVRNNIIAYLEAFPPSVGYTYYAAIEYGDPDTVTFQGNEAQSFNLSMKG